jgi:hypothetical protein
MKHRNERVTKLNRTRMGKYYGKRGVQQALKACLLGAAACWAAGYASADSAWNTKAATMEARIDVTGDGKPEIIHLQPFVEKAESGRAARRYYRLTVNGQNIYDSPLSGSPSGFILADIDRQDPSKEIVVLLPPTKESKQSGYFIYWFNGQTLHRVTQQPLLNGLFHGDKYVTVKQPQPVTQPAYTEVAYLLAPNHTLSPTTEKYSQVSDAAVVKDPFPIYSRPDLHRVAMLRSGTRVQILKTEARNWLYVRADEASGETVYGWMNTKWNHKDSVFGRPAAG